MSVKNLQIVRNIRGEGARRETRVKDVNLESRSVAAQEAEVYMFLMKLYSKGEICIASYQKSL